MRLRISTPTEIALDLEVRKLVAEGAEGAFGVLPRHIDYVTRLEPGILAYRADGPGGSDVERYVGVASGTLVKCADEVLVSTHDAILGDDLEVLQRNLAERLSRREEGERAAREALARLEIEMMRRLTELEAGS